VPLHFHTCLLPSPQASEDLARKKVRDPASFEWLKQCRFAWREDRDTVVISICDVDFEYSYEYLGGWGGGWPGGWVGEAVVWEVVVWEVVVCEDRTDGSRGCLAASRQP
jgi:hypothetical protein